MLLEIIKVIRLKNLFCVLAVTAFIACTVYAEMPIPPSLEELCKDSEVVLSAKCLRQTDETKKINRFEYVLTEFELVDVYKGDVESKIIRVLISGFNS